MTFLRIVVSIALGVVLLVLLNNAMGKLFPSKFSYSRYGGEGDAYKKCSDLYMPSTPSSVGPEGIRSVDISKEQRDKYDKCIEEENRKLNDNQALENLGFWIRSVVVLLVLVGLAIFLHKNYPFYSAALIGTGVLFLLTYPMFAKYGTSILGGGYGTELSDSVKNKLDLFKISMSLLGFACLTAADILFFEKKEKKQKVD